MLYNNMRDIGLNPEHCWELLKIAEEMRIDHPDLDDEIRNFVAMFNWWEGNQIVDAWIRLYNACIDKLKLETVLI